MELWWEGVRIAASKHVALALAGPGGAELEI